MIGATAAAAGYAVTASAANAGTPAKLHKITVTGTHIKRTNIETAQPITRISRQEIEKSGYTNIGQFLGHLPFAGSHDNATNPSSDGATRVSLRNLGADRTLVLVNGKRWIERLGGSTNLNTIPTSLIDHIEVLQDGASAIYGSDAIAGVVNIITIKNFKGAEAHAYYGIHNDPQTGSWGNQVKQYDFTIGTGNDRGNVDFNATYRKQNGVLQGQRGITPIAGEPPYVGGDTFTPSGRFQLFGPAVSGRTIGQSTCGTYDPSNPTNILCDLTLNKTPAAPSLSNFRDFKETDRVDDGVYTSLAVPDKTVTLYMQGHYDLFDHVTFTTNATYVRDEADYYGVRNAIVVGALDPVSANGEKIGVSRNNPYNPFGVDLAGDPNDPCIAAGTCIGLGELAKASVAGSAEPRDVINDRDAFHIFAGFNGYFNLFNREIDWDVGYAQNRVQSVTTEAQSVDTVHEQRALGPASQCTGKCVPADVFGGAGTYTRDQVNYVQFENHNLAQGNLRDWTADISSDVFNLPAGPLGVAIGWEHVANYGYNKPDSVFQAGNNADVDYSGQVGDLTRTAEYAELNIPLLADLPGAKDLSIDVADRWTQFTRAGGEPGATGKSSVHNSSGRFNLRWQATSDLLLRASWSQGFRSPGLGDLFGGQTTTYPLITDPCAGGNAGGYSGGPLPPNCPNGTEDNQSNSHIRGVGGSNPNLQPEKSLSRTVGFVYSPSQVPGLDVNADYFKIEITDSIGSVGSQNIVNGCFFNSSFCNLVTVTGNQITNIRNVSTNVGTSLYEGIDVGLHYKFPSTPIGDFDARIIGTFLKTYDQTTINGSTKTGFATSHLAGTGSNPKRRFNGYLNWDYGNWSAQYAIQFIGASVDQCQVSISGYCTYPNRTANAQGVPGQYPRGRQHLGATVYHDVHVSYTAPSINTTFSIGVNNLFDKIPPVDGSGRYDFQFYRLPSRLLFGSVRVKF
jgi:outer membrane receptor protein involved in Fe transport